MGGHRREWCSGRETFPWSEPAPIHGSLSLNRVADSICGWGYSQQSG